MRRLLVLLGVTAVVVLVGTQLEWRLALAPLIGLGIWAWMRATMRSFLNDGQTGVAADIAPEPLPLDERVLYWCEECGTELVLVVRGSGIAPRHCGSRMHERSEILS